jgi:hypothetical protein
LYSMRAYRIETVELEGQDQIAVDPYACRLLETEGCSAGRPLHL